jgi:hypothetical protein
MPETRATRVPRTENQGGPVWARATRTFYAESFDIRSKKQFVEAMQDFTELSPAEQAFHQAHLTFRQVQALEDVTGKLSRIETLLLGLDLGALVALKHLAPIRKALEDMREGQEDLVELMEDLGEAQPEADEEDDDKDTLDDLLTDDEELPPEPGEPTPALASEGELLLGDGPPRDPAAALPPEPQ